MCFQKDGIAMFSFIRTYSIVKRPKKSKKAKHIFKARRLKMRPKGQLNFLGEPT